MALVTGAFFISKLVKKGGESMYLRKSNRERSKDLCASAEGYPTAC